MTENPDLPPQSGGEYEGGEADVEGRGDEGRRSAQVTPPIGEDAVPGQTQVSAAEDDVGVPSDEEIGREEHQAREDDE